MLTKQANRARMARERADEKMRSLVDMGVSVLRRTGRTRQEYAEFIQGYNWDYFLTSTFRSPRKEPYYALKHVYNELSRGNVKRAFLVAEPHESGDLHIHGIVAGAGAFEGAKLKPEIELPWQLWGRLFKRFGRAKVEACNTRQAVALYCAKYVLKQQSRSSDYYEVYGDKPYWLTGLLT